MQEGKEEQNRSGAYSSPRGQALVPSRAQPDPSSRFMEAWRRDDPPSSLKRARRLVVAATTGAVAGGRAAIAGRDAVGTKGGFALILVAAVAKAKHLLTVLHLGAAPGATTIFPEHPHIEGRITVILK